MVNIRCFGATYHDGVGGDVNETRAYLTCCTVSTAVVRKLDGGDWSEAVYHGFDGRVPLPESRPSKQVGYFMHFVNLTVGNFASQSLW